MTAAEAHACIDIDLYGKNSFDYLTKKCGTLNEHARKLTEPRNGALLAKAHGAKIQKLINQGFNIDQSVMNELNKWLQQMQNPEPKPQQVERAGRDRQGMPQGEGFDELPELDGDVELGNEQPQGLREVRYQKPGQQPSIFHPGHQPAENEAQQNQGKQGQPKQGNKQQGKQPQPQQAPMDEQKSPLELALEAAMKQAEAERQERKKQHEERQQQQQQQDSEKVEELDERVTNLEQRVEVIEANYVGQEAYQDGINALQGQLDKIHQPKLISIPDRPEVKLDKRTHQAFEEVLTLAQLFQQVYIVGPAGTGKTSLSAHIAEAMGLPFGFISCTAGMAEAHLLGRMLADGRYLPTAFVNCYEQGGVFLFDEVDAADANTMLVINSALANGILSVPNRAENPVARRHADFVCLVAANTLGTGSFEYHGRNYLDAAFLDRFALSRCRVDYDIELEREMLAGDAEFCRLLHKVRHNLESTNTRRVLSTRAFISSAKLLLAGKSPEYVLDKLLLGWTDEEKARAKKDVTVPKVSPLKQIGLKNAEREKSRRDQEAAKAKKAAQELAAQAVQNRQEEVLEVMAEEVSEEVAA